MPIPTTVLDKIRYSANQYSKPVINHWPVEVVVEGSITSTPQYYPIGEVSVSWNDSNWNNIKVGQLWCIWSGSNLVSYGVVRKPSTISKLYIDGKSGGDSGIAQNINYSITAGQTIKVYTVMPLWGLLSRIKNGQFLKKFDIPYDGSGATPPPVLNMGKWQQHFADESTGLATVSFNASNSFGWLERPITGYNWVLPASATVVSGSTSSDNVTFTLPAGFHLIECTITDSAGASTTGYRPVWVNSPSYPAFSEVYPFEIGSDAQDRSGRNMSLTVYGDIDYSTLLMGMPFHFKEYAYYDGEQLPDGFLPDTFVGYMDDESEILDKFFGEKSLSIPLQNPKAMFGKIPMVSQAIVEVANPQDWTDVAKGLGTPQFIIWYVLYHHSTYLQLFDYDPLWEYDAVTGEPDNARKLNWGLNGSTLTQYIDEAASTIGGVLGCRSDGGLVFRRDPTIEPNEYRNSLDERLTFTIDENTGLSDFTKLPDVSRRLFKSVGQLRAFTLAYNGTEVVAFGSIAPGYTQMQAASSTDANSFIIKPDNGTQEGDANYRAGGQTYTNMLAGHLLAKENRQIDELNCDLLRNFDVLEPVDMYWVRLNINSDWSPRGLPQTGRCTVLRVDRKWEAVENGVFVKNVSIALEPETFGQPGETYNLDTGTGGIYTPVIPKLNILSDEQEKILQQIGVVVAVDSDGYIGRTFDGNSWDNVAGNLANVGGKFVGFAFDFTSEYAVNGFSNGAFGVWAVYITETTEGSGVYDKFEIWYTDNIFANNVVWDVQYSTLFNGSDLSDSTRIRSNPDIDGFVAVSIGTKNGMFIARTGDGSAWGLTDVGITVGDNSLNGDENPSDFTFLDSNGGIITSGWDGTGWALYYSSTTLGGFTKMSSSPIGTNVWPFIERSSDGTVYATKLDSSQITGTLSYTETVREIDPQTVPDGSGGYTPGSMTPYVDTSTTGFSVGDVEFEVRGEPLYGLELSSSPVLAVAGAAALGAICVPPPNTQNYDDGWVIPSATVSNPPATSVTTVGKIYILFNGWATVSSFSAQVIINTPCFGDITESLVVRNRFGKIMYEQTYEGDATNTNIFTPAFVFSSPIDNVSHMEFTFTMTAAYNEYPQFLFQTYTVNADEYTEANNVLYRIVGAPISPTYADITPSLSDGFVNGYTPRNPSALAIDGVNPSNLLMIGGSNFGVVRRIFSSPDSGANFSAISTEQTGLYGIRTIGNDGVAFGADAILISNDAFNSSTNIASNWVNNFNNFLITDAKGSLMIDE